MTTHARSLAIIALTSAIAASGLTTARAASENDRRFFQSIEGQWSGPGEIIAGKYKGTRFVCNFEGGTPDEKVGLSLDGKCRVGLFTQTMSAIVERKGSSYRGTFLDGAKGKGLDVIDGKVQGSKVVFSLNRKKLDGAMLAHLSGPDTMNITISVRVNDDLVPVIGVNLKRIDNHSVGSVATR